MSERELGGNELMEEREEKKKVRRNNESGKIHIRKF